MRAILVLALASCATSEPCASSDDASDCAPVDWSDSKSDASGVPATFNRNNIMTDAVLTTAAVDGNAVQGFLASSPYGHSWLADLQVSGQRFADVVVGVGSQYGVDPIVLLARMQVESSLVSATSRPSSAKINAALGCACPDGSTTCGSAGLVAQLDCAGQVLSQHFADSQNGVRGEWRVGVTMTSSDHYQVTPTDNATAALYAYTPWVLVGSGGNWLVWNVTRRFLKAFDAAGTLNLP
jgi:hypothetical protein